MSQHDIFFLSYSESNADENWQDLKARFPRAQRVHGIKGVKNAHRAVAEKSSTPFFFLIDGDNRVAEGFQFDLSLQPKLDTLYVWRAQNAVNGLVYGFGAIKLYNRELLDKSANKSMIDVATSVAPKYHIIHEVASITHFNASPLEAWRGGFRESAKLQLNCFKDASDLQSRDRLSSWTTQGLEATHGRWCLLGANQGKQFARENWQNHEAMSQLNDFEWLDSLFQNVESQLMQDLANQLEL